jgi:hypothetical protein
LTGGDEGESNLADPHRNRESIHRQGEGDGQDDKKIHGLIFLETAKVPNILADSLKVPFDFPLSRQACEAFELSEA